MTRVAGTRGYESSVEAFIETSQTLEFSVLCSDFLDFLPAFPASVLDVGAGAGQNAAALAQMNYAVVAVDPMRAFLAAARETYSNLPITWLQDSLPRLQSLNSVTRRFDFILVEAVWHHLDIAERCPALERLAGLLGDGGICAISLRNGPAGVGTHVFPTDTEETIDQARQSGLECLFRADNLPSILPNKAAVTWARIVLQKKRE